MKLVLWNLLDKYHSDQVKIIFPRDPRHTTVVSGSGGADS